jgi:hypothetical protein
MSAPACLLTLRKQQIKDFIRNNSEVSRVSDGMVELVEAFLEIKQSNPRIKKKDDIFFPADKMQSFSRNYQAIRSICCVTLNCGSSFSGKCDRIINWTSEFNELFISLAEQRIAWEYKNIRLNSKKQKFNFQFIPGAWIHNYKKTETSNRYYHPCQNLTREEAAVIYKGCLDFDMVSAFPSIFCKVVMEDETHPMLDLCMRDPEHFLQLIIDHDAFTEDVRNSEDSPRDKAKAMRSKLFHPPANGRPWKVGVIWYDNLQRFIIRKLSDKVGIDKAHLFFTAVEQEVLEQAMECVGYKNVVRRMHDGFNAINIDNAQDALASIEEATGYKWKVNRI